MLIDAHHHLWPASAEGFHATGYMPDDYAADTARLDVQASVFVECLTQYDTSLPPPLRSVGETRFVASVAAGRTIAGIQLCAAIVANANPFADMDFGAILDAHEAVAAGRLRGIRRCAAWDADPAFNHASLETSAGMLADPRYVAALRELAERGLVFDTWVYHPQIGEVAALARSAPDCAVVLDHAGTPLGTGAHADLARTEAIWRDGIARAAEVPNLFVKIGGFATPHTAVDAIRVARGLDRWTVPALAEALGPWLDHLLGCFGPERCLFESNFPVDRMTCDFATLLAAYRRTLDGLDARDQERVFGGNAASLYRIDLPAAA